MSMFKRYVGIDYSGQGKPNRAYAAIQVYVAWDDNPPERKQRPNSEYNWSRKSLADWLLRILTEPTPTIVGIDHAFSFPFNFLRQHDIGNWEAFLTEFCKQWPTDQQRVVDLKVHNQMLGDANMFRLTDTKARTARSVFDFGPPYQGEVATSTHAGIPWLNRIRRSLRNRVHFWPFDGFAPDPSKSVLAEVYPRLFRPNYERPRDFTSDQYDAWMVCSWLQDKDRANQLGNFFAPTPPDQRATVRIEGWMLGLR